MPRTSWGRWSPRPDAFGVGTGASLGWRFLDLFLLSLAVTASACGLAIIVGSGGVLVATVLYVFIGKQISGAALPPEYLSGFYHLPAASVTEPVLTLALYAVVRLLISAVVNWAPAALWPIPASPDCRERLRPSWWLPGGRTAPHPIHSSPRDATAMVESFNTEAVDVFPDERNAQRRLS